MQWAHQIPPSSDAHLLAKVMFQYLVPICLRTKKEKYKGNAFARFRSKTVRTESTTMKILALKTALKLQKHKARSSLFS